jgi:KUP system potassium uptake protein
MNINATGGTEADAPNDASHGHGQGPLYKLVIGAIGIVYGDIGTSPIYAFRETFAGHAHPRPAPHLRGPEPHFLDDDDRRDAEICHGHHARRQ